MSNTNAFLTQATDALGHVSKNAYDACTGLLRQQQDPSHSGPVARFAADLIPGFGEFVMMGQGTLATYDGSRSLYDCISKAK